MDNFEKLGKLVGAPVEAALGARLPQSLAEAKKLGATRYHTGKPCKHGHVAERITRHGACAECYRMHNASPKHRAVCRLYQTTQKSRAAVSQRALSKTGDAVLFAISQTERAATSGHAPSDIVTQCPDPQRSQLQGLIDRIRADPKAGKAAIALLRTMRKLRKAELAEASFEAPKD